MRGASTCLLKRSSLYLHCRRALQTQVFSWGNNVDGQLGHGDLSPYKFPTPISALEGLHITHIGCTEVTSFATYLKNGAELVCGWGSNHFGLVTFDEEEPNFLLPCKIDVDLLDGTSPVKKVSGGKAFVLILLENGRLYSWGSGANGQLGTDDAPDMKHPSLIEALKDQKVVKCACGSAHTVCITDEGRLYTWGNSHFSQLGHEGKFNEVSPRQVDSPLLYGRKVIDIGAGLYHTIVLTDRNEVFSWGRNDNGQCGQTRELSRVVGPGIINTSQIRREKIVHIACGLQHTLLLTESGKVISFGSNMYGQLGNEPQYNTIRALPKAIEGIPPVSKIVCGGFHSLASTGDSMFAWGENADYQIGIGDTRSCAFTPVEIETLRGRVIGEMAAGLAHSVVVVTK